MATYELNGALFADMVRGGAGNLRANAKTVNDLNVFPIPDGDTGDNMSLTMEGASAELRDVASDSISYIADKLARGMLLGARGNSGVILSQLLRVLPRDFRAWSAPMRRRLATPSRSVSSRLTPL